MESHFGGSARRLGIACRAAVAGLRISMVMLKSKRREIRKVAKGNRVRSVWNVVDALTMLMMMLMMGRKREWREGAGTGTGTGTLLRTRGVAEAR